ncbi:MAG TPA: AI-2E family transporter [Burkholderiales bacterium]|nr:AI-2E family transporter [Burkholderiales bacterium]
MAAAPSGTPLFSRPQFWAWLAIALVGGALLWLLAPILAPFLFAGILAYILDPLVEKLTRRRLPRTLSVILVMLLLLLLFAGFLLVVFPLLYKETRLLVDKLPGIADWLNSRALPWLREKAGIDIQLDAESLKQMARDAFAQNEDLAKSVLRSLGLGGLAIVAFLANLLLLPVVLFYLLRDWNVLLAQFDRLIPRRVHAKAVVMAREIDTVLAEWLRGQLLVVLIMSAYYVTALWIARLDFALPVGLITGLAVIVPYVGIALGFVLATVAALLQFDSLTGVLWVWLVIGVGQVLEGSLVTPLIVGERIGLHPVAVILALLAFGQVFGFFGVLLALPASAVLLVALRHLRAAYLAGPLYGR